MYPNFAKSERIADGTIHAIGVLGALAGTLYLLIRAAGTVPPMQMTALTIYGTALIATFAASALYHMTPWPNIRPTLRRFDHAAIYLKIAGTYTPLVVIAGGALSYLILATVWLLAVVGITLKLFFWRTPGRFSPALYLIMGWMSLGLIWTLWPVVPTATIALIATGGLLYTIGVAFYVAKIKYATAIWHGYVVLASACFFAAITIATDPAFGFFGS